MEDDPFADQDGFFDQIDYDAVIAMMDNAEDDAADAKDEPLAATALNPSTSEQQPSSGTFWRRPKPIVYDFSSKSTATLPGSNELFKHKIVLHPEFIHPKLTYAEGERLKYPTAISKQALATFEHYMSAWLVIKKPFAPTPSQIKFLDTHKVLLTVKEPDFMSKDGKPKDKYLFVETSTALILPRPYALTLYGPTLFFAYKPTTAMATSTPVTTSQSNADQWKRMLSGLAAFDVHDEITPLMIESGVQPNEEPGHPCVPPQHLPIQSLHSLPAECWTRPLQLNPDLVTLRKDPLDQLHIILAILRQCHQAILQPHHRTSNKRQTKTIPDMMVLEPCGVGKTIQMLTTWLLFDSPLHLLQLDDLQPSYTNETYDYLRQQDQPRKTVKALFIVHQHTLIDQACETIEDVVKGVRINTIEGVAGKKLPNPNDVDILVISTDTLAQCFDALPKGYLNNFPLVLLDEAHRNKALSFESALRHLSHQFWKLSVTATLRTPYFDAYGGSVLFFMERPDPPEQSHTNMIVYAAGEQQERFFPATKNMIKPRMNLAAQTTDIYMDFVRHAWTAHLSIGGFVPSAWQRLFNDPLLRQMRLVECRNMNLALGITYTAPEPKTKTFGLSKPTLAFALPSTATTSAAMVFDINNMFDMTKSGGSNNTSKRPTVVSPFFAPDAAVATPSKPSASAKPNNNKPRHDKPSIIYPPIGRRTVEVKNPFTPTMPTREPIFFSTSIPHLVVQYLWQAQLYMDTVITNVPRKFLRLVRIGARQIAIVDIQPMLEHPEIYAPHWFRLDTGNPPATSALPSLKTRYQKPKEWEAAYLPQRPASPQALAQFFEHEHEFGHTFWYNWFAAYPHNDEWKVRLRDPESYDKADFSKPKYKHPKMTAAAVGNDPRQQPFLAKMEHSNRLIYWMYYWLPIYGPLQGSCFAPSENGSKTSWRREILKPDVRPPLPGIIATFGLVIGKQYNIPAAIGIGSSKISRAHEREALDSTFVFATDALASTGIDKPRKCSSFESMYILDNEQCDGRCLRLYENKQQVYLKNELIDPWSCYQQAAWVHRKLYLLENRKICYYRIEKLGDTQ